MARYRLDHIRPNPWRNMGRYPIRQAKVDTLKESISKTDWWDNVLARPDPEDPDYAQLAYGHHRRQALLELYGEAHQVELTIRDLDDAQMIQIMANENMEEWGSSATTQHETIRTVVEAYAAGAINLRAGHSGDNKSARKLTRADVEQIRTALAAGASQEDLAAEYGVTTQSISHISTGKSWNSKWDSMGPRVRIAPSFLPYKISDLPEDADPAMAYTPADIGTFLGWVQKDGKPQWRIRDGLAVLEVIELGILNEQDFEGLSSWQAGKVAQKARMEYENRKSLARQETRPEVKEKILAEGIADSSDLARHIIQDLTSKARGTTQIDESAVASGKLSPRPKKAPPRIDDFAERTAAALNKMLLATANKRIRDLQDFIKYQAGATSASRKEVQLVLMNIAAQAAEYASQIQIDPEDQPVFTAVQVPEIESDIL